MTTGELIIGLIVDLLIWVVFIAAAVVVAKFLWRRL